MGQSEGLAQRLTDLMQAEGIGAAELSRRCHVKRQTIENIMHGRVKDPRTETLRALADYFHVSVDDLVGPPGGVRSTAEPTGPFAKLPQEEQALLRRYRRLRPDEKAKIMAIIDVLGPQRKERSA